MNIRQNWRIILLVVFVVASGVALFAPTGGAAAGPANVTTSTGPTNLQYGLELSGGLRLRGSLVGLTAEDVAVTRDNARSVRQTVSDELGLDGIDVEVRPSPGEAGSVEVFSRNVTEQEFADALTAAGLSASPDTIRTGVTGQTLSTAAEVLDRKIDRTGLSGGGASVVNTATGESYVVIETPSTNRTQVLETVGRQGRVEIVALYPVDTGNGTEYRRTSLLTQGDFRSIGQATPAQRGNPPYVSVTLTDAVAQNYSDAMAEYGFLNEGVSNCRWQGSNTSDPGWCLLTVVDGNVTYSAGMGDRLARNMRQGTWVDNPQFRMQTNSLAEAQQVKIDLETGALPTELVVESYNKILPSLAQKFKPLALITGLVAWTAVSGVIFYRYRQLEVAVPMLLTAAAEVFILLGFAASVGLALDLSHIAGFIAVIGTGVDDLVIIADEILQEGKVATGRVFQSRFRKAFWVIGAAAATTIIAMSPLTVLGLGDLSGFAIVTIVGVLIGVLITRPAYGDVLRALLVSQEKTQD
jgi:preprotein translocase subunit SecD